jgi:hypothetical protein
MNVKVFNKKLIDQLSLTSEPIRVTRTVAQSFTGAWEQPQARKKNNHNKRGKQYSNLSEFVYNEFLPEYDAAKPDEVKQPRITVDDIGGKLKYKFVRQKTDLQRGLNMSCHNGQFKLGLTEIQFLTHFLENKQEEAIVIYAGSNPSNKAELVFGLFPNVKVIMIDPNEVNIYHTGFHDSHYSHSDSDKYMYMSVSSTNSNYVIEGDDKTKWVRHYKNPNVKVDKQKLTKDIPYDGADALDYIMNSNHRYYFFEEYMTKQIAEDLSHVAGYSGKVFFWSDIRTNSKNETGNNHARRKKPIGDEEDDTAPCDLDIIANTAMHYVWIKTLIKQFAEDPVANKDRFASMLKFRVPYMDDPVIEWRKYADTFAEAKELGVDYKAVVEKTRSIEMFQGKIYIQAYAGRTSAENRLWSTLEEVMAPTIVYPLLEHEEKLFYYNVIERFAMKFANPYADSRIGFDCCGDCAIAAHIYKEYVEKHDPDFDVISAIVKFGRVTGRNMFRGAHGYNY